MGVKTTRALIDQPRVCVDSGAQAVGEIRTAICEIEIAESISEGQIVIHYDPAPMRIPRANARMAIFVDDIVLDADAI
jgi:hypothetical protein